MKIHMIERMKQLPRFHIWGGDPSLSVEENAERFRKKYGYMPLEGWKIGKDCFFKVENARLSETP